MKEKMMTDAEKILTEFVNDCEAVGGGPHLGYHWPDLLITFNKAKRLLSPEVSWGPGGPAGPLHMGVEARWTAYYGTDGAVVASESGTVCTITDEMNQYKEAAALIAAAPEMLAVLETLVSVQTEGDYYAVADEARAAIAKAKSQ